MAPGIRQCVGAQDEWGNLLSFLISLSRGPHRLRLDIHRARCHARAATPKGAEVTIDPKQIVTIVLGVLLALPLPYFTEVTDQDYSLWPCSQRTSIYAHQHEPDDT